MVDGHTRTILVVDDDPTVLDTLVSILEHYDFQVRAAGGVAEAMRLLESGVAEIDAVLSDVRMPEASGVELISRIRTISADLPVILMTGYVDLETAVSAVKQQAFDFLTKPIDFNLMVSALEKAVRHTRLLRLEKNYYLELANTVALRTSELQASEERYRLLFDKMLNGFALHEIICSDDGQVIDYRFLEVNPALELQLGLTRQQMVGCSFRTLFSEPHQSLITTFGDVALRGEPAHFTLHFSSLDKYFEVLAFSPQYGQVAATFEDITGRICAERQLAHQANYDQLTGLPNRNLLRDRLEHSISLERRHHDLLAVMFLDLHNFKIVNETLGHAAGDLMLRDVGIRLRRCVREYDTVARLGGDEFAIILTELKAVENLARIAEKLLSLFSRSFYVSGREIFASANIGIAVYPTDGDTVDCILRNATQALHHAKLRGNNCFQFFAGEMNAMVDARLTMETRLHKALERGEFILHYQPKIDLATGAIVGMEALLRWQPDGMALVSPADFIPLLEETGLILPVGEWVVRTACLQNRLWQKQGLPALRVATNISARQFHQGELPETIASILQESGLGPECLEIELTESILMQDLDETVKKLDRIKEMGITISIDDFGLGYSSLSYLKRFPIDELKIDRSFVNSITSDQNDATIAATIIAMAHCLDMRVVAEGVETEEQLVFLREHKCEEVQGYYFSKPLPPEEFSHLVQNWNPGKAQVGVGGLLRSCGG